MADTVKKTKAPGKPRAAATKSKKTMTSAESFTPIGPTQEQIAQLAHKFWAERGRHHGHAEQDWLRAERELRGMAS